MYAEGGWQPGWEPSREPPRRPRLSGRQERVILWLVAANLVLMLVAPIGGATLLHAAAAMLSGP
jgi:hypothetical protein